MSAFVSVVEKNYDPHPSENVMESLFKQYERVVFESLITSFGLDIIIQDQHGGDVDTILNVRQIGNDPNLTYKNVLNKEAYENRGGYNSDEYHGHSGYLSKNREIHEQKQSGTLVDAYTGKTIAPNGKSDLDHTISAKEIHEDAGRVLSGLRGADLANSPENLNATNSHTNRTKKASAMEDFLQKYGDEYTQEEKEKMLAADKKSRSAYETKLKTAYYTSPRFWNDTAKAAGKTATLMGVRQVCGFIFTEVWFSVNDEFKRIEKPFELSEVLLSIGNGVKRGFESAKVKYKELIQKFTDGAFSGILSSLTTTLCNIFVTTAKNTIRIIRQTYASLVQASKILFLNPDNLPFGERMRAALKIIATGASVVLGTLVNEAIDTSPVGKIPVLGEVISGFCGSLVAGILTCTLLYFLDQSEISNKLVAVLNTIPSISSEVNYYTRQAELFEEYAAKLMDIDLQKFKREVQLYSRITQNLTPDLSEDMLHRELKSILSAIGVGLPWQGDFNEFMLNKNNRLVFG